MYSDQVYRNVSLSLKKFLDGHAALVEMAIQFLTAFDPTKFYQKPILLIDQLTPRPSPMGIDGGFWMEDFDDAAQTVDTINARKFELDFTLDLGCDTAADREKWAAIIDRIFEDAEDAGIPVYDLEADPASTTELGLLRFGVEEDLAHNLLPEIPEDRTLRDSIRFTPDYLHLFVKVADQDQLTGVELQAKEVAI